MGLAIAVFVPEGIVIASDGLSEIRNAKNDAGFFQTNQKNIFVYKNKYIICALGSGYANGLPYAYYIEKVIFSLSKKTYISTYEFARDFDSDIRKSIGTGDNVLFYIAGVDTPTDDSFSPKVYLIDNNQIVAVNQGKNNEPVYNYHSIGRSVWLNKLLLPTSLKCENNKYIDFETFEIDFSKYSLDDAVLFASNMIYISYRMDDFAQLKQMVGKKNSIGIVDLIGNAYILTIDK
jgi:hypothetical protein